MMAPIPKKVRSQVRNVRFRGETFFFKSSILFS
jgi:hypothetical protein